MCDSLLAEDEERKSQGRFSILAPGIQAHISLYPDCRGYTPTFESKPEATKQGRKTLRDTITKTDQHQYSILS